MTINGKKVNSVAICTESDKEKGQTVINIFEFERAFVDPEGCMFLDVRGESTVRTAKIETKKAQQEFFKRCGFKQR